MLTLASAQSLPVGGSVAAGSAIISQPNASSLTVTQSSQSAVVNWQSFSVGQGSSVTFAQPNASSAILNRVTSNATSTIAGQVNANGQVYLVNPNGIAITKSGTINAGGFVASTLGISDSDFMAGKRTFTGNGASAAVSNAGTISVGRGGYAALIGGTVSNSGSIDVPLGKVGLGSGERATLDFSGDGFLQVAVPTGAGGKGALIRNSGTIKADGGSVVISAATAREAARNAINISGTIQARSIGGRSGSIVIGGGGGGRVKITGRLDTSSRRHSGGSIQITGRDIKLKGASVDASGKTGGGTINIGGNYQGRGPLQRAETVSIDKTTTINADARESGNGGNVVVWSDLLTTFAGTISARGGALSGNGGDAEVSGRAMLDYTGTTDLRAPHGITGTLLLDPYNVIISNGTQTTGAGFTANGNDSIVNATTLSNALATASVIVTTGDVNSAGQQAGNITVNAPISWSSANMLTLTAANAIAVNAPITISGGGQLALNTATTTVGSTAQPLLSFGSGASVIFATNANQGTQALSINTNPYTLVRDMTALAGLNNQTGRYALAIDLTSSTTYGGAVIGSFSGTLEGLGHTISNLTINGSGNVGLIGTLNPGGTVRDLGIVGGTVSANSNAGGLVGTNAGMVMQSYNTGTVSLTQEYSSTVGGLVGTNTGTVAQSYATGAVSIPTATGNVGNVIAGGLVGQNSGQIIQSYATGAVSAVFGVGGLVGSNSNSGTITQSYSTGAVSGITSVGGLVGASSGTVSASYWDTQTSGQSTSAGGTGVTTAQLADGTSLATLNSGRVVWGNAGNKTTPYLLNNIGPVLLGSGGASTTYNTPILTQVGFEAINRNTSANYVLANNLDLSGTTYGGSVIGGFSGTLDGLGNTLSNLTISSYGNDVIGMIGTLNSSGTVRGLGLIGGSVFGRGFVGGLVGNNSGTVTQSFSTGSVDGNAVVGGLVGNNTGTVSQSYATGAVTGYIQVGGLVGAISGNTAAVTQSYATGAVSASNSPSGLIGQVSGGTVSQSYWDMQTSGQGSSAGGTGLTTRQLQGLDPLSGSGQGAVYFSTAVNLGSNGSSTFSGGIGGLYPYLTRFFPNGVQAVSGFAYKGAGATPLASGVSGAVPLKVVGGNSTLGTATIGANGYYYVFGQPGTIANGASVIAYTTANNTTGATNAARIATSTYATNTPLQTGLDIYEPVALTFATTPQTTFSGYLVSVNGTLPTAPLVPAGTAIPGFVSNAVPSVVTTGTSFTFETPATISAPIGFATALSNAPLTVTAPVTVASGGALGLSAAGALTINTNITVNGAGSVALGYDRNTATPSSNDLSFGLTGSGFTGGITYAGNGGALSINSSPYTLLYSMTDVQNVNNNTAGNYALAGNLSAAGTIYTGAIVGGNGNFSGNFEGLGHTISNLTINGGSTSSGVGFFHANVGTIRDVGLVGGSVSGHDTVGDLVGVNGGTVQSSYATGAVSGLTGQQFYATSFGGLVGWNFPNGTIQASYATGAVSSGQAYSGGLVGSNQGNITQSYATGAVSGSSAVSGGSFVGGLVGEHDTGTIRSSYATGAVWGSDYVGGLIGLVNSGSIQSSYATGAVSSAGSNFGGFVGNQQGGAITAGYWDTLTSGRGVGIGGANASQAGVTGLTTAVFQSNANGYMSQLGSAFSGGTGGLYPYLTRFFPNGVQAVSGIAYKDAGVTPLASGASGAVGVTVIGANTTLGTFTTGANGYYYAFGAPGTIANGAGVVAYTTANGATGATNAAGIAKSTYTTNTPAQSGIDIWAPVTLLAGSTNATSWSAAGLNTSAIPALPTGSTLPSFLNGALPTYVATNAQGFTFDATLSVTNGFAVQTTASGAGITVSNPIAINNGGSLGLYAAGALSINANITAKGAVGVALNAGLDTSTVPGTPLLQLSFAQGASLAYTDVSGNALTAAPASNAGTLSINGNPYTLLYNMTDVASINGGNGFDAIATNLTAGNYNNAVVGNFSGTLEGLGHTISNLTITGSNSSVGLIGTLNGTVRDLGLVGGSIAGNNRVGGLVGANNGAVIQSYAAATISGNNSVGGLVGYSGGLVTRSYATGAVSGSDSVGGLVGFIQGGSGVLQSYATASASGGTNVGGLVGYLKISTITQSFATGAVSGSSGLGGLVGLNNSGSISNSAWDTKTSGLSVTGVGSGSSSGVTGLTTSQLQSNSNGFMSNLGVGFAGGTGGLYPYLKTFFPNGVQAVSGVAYKDNGATPAASGASGAVNVSVLSNGAAFGTAATGANGYYYVLGQLGSLASGASLVAYTQTNSATGAKDAATYTVATTDPNNGNINVYGGWNLDRPASTITTLSALNAFETAAAGSSPALGLTFANRDIRIAAQNFSLDTASATTGTLALDSTSTVTQSAAIAAGSLRLSGTGGAFALTQAGNAIDTIAASTGSVTLANAGALSTSTLSTGTLSNASGTTIAGVTTSGAISLATPGNLKLASGAGVSGASPVLSTGGAFVNNAGANGVVATNGTRFLVWSQNPANDFVNNLVYDFKQYNAPFGTTPAQTTGNGLLYAVTPTVVVGSDASFDRPYDGTVTTRNLGNTPLYAVSGLYADDSFRAVPGTTGTFSSKDVGNRAVTIDSSSLVFTDANRPVYGYQVTSNITGNITPRLLSVNLSVQNKVYDGLGTATYVLNSADVLAGDTVTYSAAQAPVFGNRNVGTYTLQATGITLGGSGAANYAVSNSGIATQASITRRSLTITADAQTRVYGDANPALTYTIGGAGLVNNDALTGALATTATPASNVGYNYTITQGTLTASSNYTLSYTGANLSVTPRALSVTADAQSRVYGDANPTLTYQTSGLVNGDGLIGALTTSATATSNVGNYAIDRGSLAASTNYAVTYNGANLSVTARALTVTADAKSRIYGEGNPALTYTSSGLVNGDGLTGALATSANASSNVGGYAITQNTLAASSNYTLSYIGANLSVTPRALTVSANAQSRAYGDTNPALTYTSSGLVNGDGLTGALATSANATSNVGNYGITQNTLAASSNYTLSYSGANLSVTPRALTVTADAQSRAYGDANPALTYASSGLVNGDGLSGALATSATTTSNVGAYAITQNTLAASSNYTLSYTGANLSVTPRALTVTADAQSRIYGDVNPSLSYQTSGLVNGDGLTGALATSATTSSNVGAYAITQNTLAASPNYTLSYTGANLSVTPRTIYVNADWQYRIYGDSNPVLAYTVGGRGLVNGDTLSGGLATTATITSNVGSYPITQGTLAASPNYTLIYNPAATVMTPAPGMVFSSNGTLGVVPKLLMITASNQSKVYGDTLNLGTTAFTQSGLVDNDSITSVTLTSAGAAAGASVAGSPYAIVPSNAIGTGLSNYLTIYKQGALTLNTAPVMGVGSLASIVTRDQFYPVSLPDTASPVFGAAPILTSLGTGTLYADPRSDSVFVCFGGGFGTAPSCYATGR